jgi:hypothetical protein
VSHKQTAESFWAKVTGDRRKRNSCWEWQGAKNNTGYGTVAWHGRTYTAHRVAAWLVGLVDDPARPESPQSKSHVLHTCDNRACCNPKHFFVGSYSDNQFDAYTKGRRTQPRGQHHTNAKMTNAQAKAVREAYEKGASQTKLAVIYGVSQSAISQIVRGVTYK